LAGKGIDETRIVSRLAIPLAVVVGSKDNALGLEYISHLKYLSLWHDKTEVITEAEHAIVYHQAGLLNTLLENFIRNVKGKSS
jgi:hypothetical protein